MNRRSCAKYSRRSFPLALAGILVSKGGTRICPRTNYDVSSKPRVRRLLPFFSSL